jgi:hypothetical protein
MDPSYITHHEQRCLMLNAPFHRSVMLEIGPPGGSSGQVLPEIFQSPR